jgi:hypothetical protein
MLFAASTLAHIRGDGIVLELSSGTFVGGPPGQAGFIHSSRADSSASLLQRFNAERNSASGISVGTPSDLTGAGVSTGWRSFVCGAAIAMFVGSISPKSA